MPVSVAAVSWVAFGAQRLSLREFGRITQVRRNSQVTRAGPGGRSQHRYKSTSLLQVWIECLGAEFVPLLVLMHLWLFSSAVNVLDLSTEGANALFFMIDGQDVVLFGILIMETSDKRLWYGSTNVSQYKSFISTISLHFILHIRCNLFNDSDFLFAMLATVQKHRKLPIVVSTTIK